MTDPITHAPFCMAQPGEPGPRIESFRSERTNDTGHVVARPLVVRCVDCGEQIVQG
jgi:hypothetical protein